MARCDTISGSISIQKVQDDVLKALGGREVTARNQTGAEELRQGWVRPLLNGAETTRPRVGSLRRCLSQFLSPQISGVTSDKVPLLDTTIYLLEVSRHEPGWHNRTR